jgi:hypothetical protein
MKHVVDALPFGAGGAQLAGVLGRAAAELNLATRLLRGEESDFVGFLLNRGTGAAETGRVGRDKGVVQADGATSPDAAWASVSKSSEAAAGGEEGRLAGAPPGALVTTSKAAEHEPKSKL